MSAINSFPAINACLKIIKTLLTWILLLVVLACACPASAFEANAMWFKGDRELNIEEVRKLDPSVNMAEFKIGNDEIVSLFITYSAPARDEKKWAKVSYQLSVVKPDGKPDEMDSSKELLAGEGIIPDEHAQDWAISHDELKISFSKEDERGDYVFKIRIKDHISGETIKRVTKIHLK